jgi:glycosyltransferase involved in cell wall biosynthesis
VAPDRSATFKIPQTDIALTGEDEVVTYVARNLEPYRGFPSFMRSLPVILAQRPKAQVLVVGGDGVSYGPKPPKGTTFRALLLKELGCGIDLTRVHFLGRIPYSSYVRLLQVSRVHVYLTYPFVLSWSMLEAMSAGCLVVGSSTPPVKEVIRDGRNGLLVDIFSPDAISRRVIEGLANRENFDAIRISARKTIIEHYDLKTICLPAQLRLLNMAARGVL